MQRSLTLIPSKKKLSIKRRNLGNRYGMVPYHMVATPKSLTGSGTPRKVSYGTMLEVVPHSDVDSCEAMYRKGSRTCERCYPSRGPKVLRDDEEINAIHFIFNI